MDTNQILDLFQDSSTSGFKEGGKSQKTNSSQLSTKHMLEELDKEGLYDDDYETLGMDEFMKGLK